MGLLIVALVAVYYKDLLALSYDEEFARIRGVPVTLLYFLLIGMLAVTIVMVIQVVGLILVIALLTIPPFIMEKHAKSLLQMMVGPVCWVSCLRLPGCGSPTHSTLPRGHPSLWWPASFSF
jgi:zinc transport system permease protein